MKRWEFFESGMGLACAKAGIISMGLLCKYDRYKMYREFLNAGYNDTEARQMTEKKTKLNQSTIARDIYWFERDEDPFYAKARKNKDIKVMNSR